MIKTIPQPSSLKNVVNRTCATLRLHDISHAEHLHRWGALYWTKAEFTAELTALDAGYQNAPQFQEVANRATPRAELALTQRARQMRAVEIEALRAKSALIYVD